MKVYLSSILLLFSVCIHCQNIVPNPDFEVLISCPLAIDDFPVNSWVSPTMATPDYFNACGGPFVDVPDNIFGFQASETGNAYAGIISYLEDDTGGIEYKEYIQVELNSPTIEGACYEISVTYSPGDDAGFSDGLGVLLTNGIPSVYTGQTPQLQKSTVVEDRGIWHTLTGTYTATGNETHLTIGNYNFDDETTFVEDPNVIFKGYSYFYIDEVVFQLDVQESPTIDVDLGPDISSCNISFPVTLSSNNPSADNLWSTGEVGPSIEVQEPGTYSVQSIIECEFGTDTIEIVNLTTPVLDLEDEVTFCAGDSVELEVNADENTTVLWNTGSQETSIIVEVSDTYTIVATNQCGTTFDTVLVSTTEELDEIDLGEDKQLCIGETLVLEVGNTAGEILWNTGSEEPTITVIEGGIYTVTLTASCGESTDSILVEYYPLPPALNLEDTILLCSDAPHLVSFNSPPDVSILWSTGSTDTVETFASSGDYFVEVSNACAIDTTFFTVKKVPLLDAFSLPEDITLCDESSYLLESEIIQEDIEITWNTDDDSPSINIDESGLYWVEVTNECYTFRDSINVNLSITPQAFDLGFDDTICSGVEFLLDGFQGDNFDYQWQDGNSSPTYDVTNSGTYSLAASNFCGSFADTISLIVLESEDIPTSLDDVYSNCEGIPLIIDLGDISADEILWNDGSTDRIRELLIPDFYSIELKNACTEKTIEFEFKEENCTELKVFIPNAFTPNSDGINDAFLISIRKEWQIESFDFTVYNRWGERVYLSNSITESWDGSWKGQNLSIGTYAFYLYLTAIDNDGDEAELSRSGTITLLR